MGDGPPFRPTPGSPMACMSYGEAQAGWPGATEWASNSACAALTEEGEASACRFTIALQGRLVESRGYESHWAPLSFHRYGRVPTCRQTRRGKGSGQHLASHALRGVSRTPAGAAEAQGRAPSRGCRPAASQRGAAARRTQRINRWTRALRRTASNPAACCHCVPLTRGGVRLACGIWAGRGPLPGAAPAVSEALWGCNGSPSRARCLLVNDAVSAGCSEDPDRDRRVPRPQRPSRPAISDVSAFRTATPKEFCHPKRCL